MLNTIRGRIVAVFVACLAFVVILTVFYYWSISSIERRLAIAENFEDLFNDILEIRRYEKNFLFYRDRDSLNQNIFYIGETKELTAKLAADIAKVIGDEQLGKFSSDLDSYKGMMAESQDRMERQASQIEVEKIRAKGKELVDFSQNLLRIKRERIHRALTRTLSIPIAFAGSLVLLIVLIFQLVVRNILKPLALIQRTTEDVARGNYTPIPYEERRRDEISELIAAFNKMSGEIESRQEEVVQSRKIAAIGTFIGLKKIDLEHIMPVALLSSAFFVAGLVHVPLGPGSVHLMLIGLLGVMLGWAAFPAILIALFLQTLFFQFGGFAVLGVNTVTMSVPALCCYYLTRPWMDNPKIRPAAACIAGFLAIFLA